MTELAADPAATAAAQAELERTDAGQRMGLLVGQLATVVQTLAEHGLDDTGRACLRRGLAWVGAGNVIAQQHSRWAYERTADVAAPVRTSRFGLEFDILPDDVDGYDPGRRQ